MQMGVSHRLKRYLTTNGIPQNSIFKLVSPIWYPLNRLIWLINLGQSMSAIKYKSPSFIEGLEYVPKEGLEPSHHC